MLVMNGKTKSKIKSKFNHQWLSTSYADRNISYKGNNSTNQCTTLSNFTSEFKNLFGSAKLDAGLKYQVYFSVDYEITCSTSTAGTFYIQCGAWPYTGLTDTITIANSQKGHLGRVSTIQANSSYSSSLSNIYVRCDNVPTDTTLKFSNWKLGLVTIGTTREDDSRTPENTSIKDIFHECMTDSDGTVWLHLMHQNRKGSLTYGMFKASGSEIRNTFVYESPDVWSACCLMKTINHGNDYEFLVTQSTNGGSKTRYRWKQTVNPYEGTFATTTHTNITTIENIGSSYGGMYVWSENNAWCFNNGNNGNWFGCGNRSNWDSSSNLMLPGYNGMNVTGEQDLYIRVYNIYK